MIPVYFEKYANFDRISEPCSIAVPFPKGKLENADSLCIRNAEGKAFPTQAEATAYWDDGSIKWVYIDFMCDLPKNKDITYYIDTEPAPQSSAISTSHIPGGLRADSGVCLFDFTSKPGFYLNGKPAITDGDWEVVKNGSVVCVLKAKGKHEGFIDFEITAYVYKNKPWIKIDYRIINNEKYDYVSLESLSYDLPNNGEKRFTIATSNYLTKYITGDSISKKIDTDYLLYDANEHFAEVFYGTFFGDISSEDKGTAVSVYQAYQNFPSEITIDNNKMHIGILAAEDKPVRFFRGMAKTSTIFIHNHNGIPKEEINLKSLMFQMPDKGVIPSKVYEDSGCFPDIFLPEGSGSPLFEQNMTRKLDQRGRAYGFIHWGDNIDYHYTSQGRGNGRPVWVNNEYDFGHAAYLYYVRTGIRRALDGALVSIRHQLDVDIVHSSDDPLRLGGQVTHSADHVSGKVEISHEWVEGLLDYYHLTADKTALTAAKEMGENIIRQLALPRYMHKGGINARETGWALRSLCALYQETYDSKWLKPCDDIVSHFSAWKEEYGGWLAPYTDHTLIRVPFMISIAIISLMRYYNIKKNDEIKDMIVEAAKDLTENAYLDSGYFYYKELSSLKRNAGNTTLLEALTAAYRLTGNTDFLMYGKKTFLSAVSDSSTVLSFAKRAEDDALVVSGNSSKGVGQSFLPLLTYFTACTKAGIKLIKEEDQ